MSSMSGAEFSDAIGLLGGAFDPPHVGHERLALEILERFPLRELRFLPNNGTAMKSPRASSQHRVACLKRLTERNPRFALESYEVDHQPPHSTHSTLSTLIQQGRLEPKKTVFFMGTDQWIHWDAWKRFPEVCDLTNWVILLRRGIDPVAVQAAKTRYVSSGILSQIGEMSFRTRGGRIVVLSETSAPEISSTQIRESFALTGQAPLGTLPSSVEAYLMEHHVYGK